MTSTIKLADYLFTRLQQLGVGAVHGVPGDYNLTLLDYVEPSGLQWVGNANELNAGYAADAYSRIKGVGALITTFGVGELSAINAIAGAYTERAAVVHIVATPDRASQDGRAPVHHTFNDGEYRRFAQMHTHVTVAQTSLRDPRTSPAQIDDVLRSCIIHSRPVYIELPVDLVPAPVSAERLQTPITIPDAVPNTAQETALKLILERIHAAKKPAILVDGEIRAMRVVEEVQALTKAVQWPTFSTPFSKGLMDESLSNFHGIFTGNYGSKQIKDFMDSADLVLCFGPHFSTTNSYAATSVPKPEISILFTDTQVKMGNQIFRDVPARLILSELLKGLDSSKVNTYGETYPELPRDQLINFKDLTPSEPITQDKVWQTLATFVRPGDIVFGETGTAGYGCRVMVLPKHARMFTPVTWLSIGYMLPGAQGAALAQRELLKSSKYHGLGEGRTILLIGDGSFQMTVQELGTIIRLNLDVIVVLINNDGYTIERVIHGLKQNYNDVGRWNYLLAPQFFGAKKDTYTAQARTWGELQQVLESEPMQKGKGLRMIEVFMDREDVPPGMLTALLERQVHGTPMP